MSVNRKDVEEHLVELTDDGPTLTDDQIRQAMRNLIITDPERGKTYRVPQPGE